MHRRYRLQGICNCSSNTLGETPGAQDQGGGFNFGELFGGFNPLDSVTGLFANCEFDCMIANIGKGADARNACIASCNPGNTYNSGGGFNLNTILPIVLIGGVAYLILK